jgi:IMP dehydrogenase
MKIVNGYTFDDLLLVPKKSEIKSRQDVSLKSFLGKNFSLDLPICSSNMTNVTEHQMANAMANHGGMALLHRFCSVEEQVSLLKKCNNLNLTGASIGILEESKGRLDALVDNGCKIICIDVAHAHHEDTIKMTEYVAKKYPQVLLISGNVVTPEGALALYNAGADIIKVGIGNGSICTTRIETGNGYPQLSALELVYRASLAEPKDWLDKHLTNGRKFAVMSDGGIRRVGDIVKALCFSDVVMLGSMLAGTDEAPGEQTLHNGVWHKAYAGSSTHKSKHVEGVRAMVPLKGPVANILSRITDGLRSGLSYQGAKTLLDLKKDPEFVLMSNAGLIESLPHDVIVKG